MALRSSIHPCFTWHPLRAPSTPAVCWDLSLSFLCASLDTYLVTARPLLGDTGHRVLYSPSPWPRPLDLGCHCHHLFKYRLFFSFYSFDTQTDRAVRSSPPHHHFPDIGSYTHEALALWPDANQALCVCFLGGHGERARESTFWSLTDSELVPASSSLKR